MISFIQIPYRKPAAAHAGEGLKPGLVVFLLGLILCLQAGLVLWLYLWPAR